MFFDSHAHYDDKRFDADRDALLKALPSHGVRWCVNSGSDVGRSRKGIAIAERYDYIYAAVGVHPHYAGAMTEGDLSELKRMAGHPKVVAIGETGLDYYYKNSLPEDQRFWFRKQLGLALELKLPAIVHSRDAAAECREMIGEFAAKGLRGVVHCFSDDADTALYYTGLGFYIGIGGVITFPKPKKLLEAVEAAPINKILLETDCPYLSPAPFRGERNDSGKIGLIAAKIAEIKNISVAETAEITGANAAVLFFGKKDIA